MATTVGANSLNVETVVSQPCSDQVDLMVDGLDYVFDQAKFEEYLSSSSKSSSPRKHRRNSISKREVRSVIVRGESRNNTPANYKAGSSADSVPKEESSLKVSATLSKRARQRQRQKAAHKLAKSLESTDGVHYRTNSREQRRPQTTAPQSQLSSTPAKEEWVLVKRTRLTKKERAQRRRARAARAREIIRKAQESQGSNRKVWIPKSAPNMTRKPAATRDSENCLASRAAVQTAAPAARQQTLPRQLRDSVNCRAHVTFTRGISNCLGQREVIPDTFDCPGQTSSSPLRPSTSQEDISTTKSEKSTSVFNRLGPLPGNQGKAPVHERLSHARQRTGGRVQNINAVRKRLEQAGTSQKSKIPVATRLSIPQGVRESAKRNNLKQVIRKVTRDDKTLVSHTEASSQKNDRRPQKKTCLSIKDNVTLGDKNAICDEPHQPKIQCISRHGEETHHHAVDDNTRKRTIDDINCSCSCAQLIKTLLSGCACSESKSLPRRASVFGRLSLPMTEESTAEESKPRRRRFRKRRSTLYKDEFPEVTINMVSKGKGAVTTDSDPDFTPEGKVSARISQRMSQLQLRATRRRDYRRMHEGESSEDEDSDSYSAVASDDTVSSVGQLREAYTITTETLAQMLQEALAKQREELKAEMKMEMELAMQQMRELQNQKIPQPESSQQAGPSRNTTHDVVDSDTEVEDNTIPDPPLKKTQSGDDTTHSVGGGNPKQNESESEKMRELEGKINALMSAQEIKKTGIPCPYPREWDSIPYPAKFSLINFTPFDGKGSPTQHLIYFKSHLGVISGNEPLMVRSFVGTLRGAAFDWYRRLKYGSINCWNDMESLFLSNFFDDDTEVSIGTLLDEKQKSGESIDTFVKRFRNKAVNCKDPITEEFILQTCHNNLSIDLLEVMRVVPPTSWKDLKIRGEQAERFLRRKKTERSKTTADPSEINFDSHNKENASMIAVDVGQTSKLRPRQQPREQQKASKSEFHGTYSFTDEEVPVIFKYLLDGNKIKLPPITNQEEADKTSDPKYCAYHRRILHPTKDCIALKAIIQALVEAGVLTPK